MSAPPGRPLPDTPFAAGPHRQKGTIVRPFSPAEVETILAEHRRWSETGRKEGARASF